MATMRYPLTLTGMLERNRRFFGRKEVVSRYPAGLFRYTYADYYRRVCQLAHALAGIGIGRGDWVATLAWNHHRHLEAYFAVPCLGAVLHTANFRLPPDHLAHILNHAGDRVLLLDEDFIPLVEALAPRLTTVHHYVVFTDKDEVETSLPGAVPYERFIAGQPETYPWPDLDEWDPAAMCYTSATTGNPKGVVYTHRALYLHTMALCMADAAALGERDTIMPVVPMFHVNAWGMPFAAVWTGARAVLPGPRPDPATLAQLIQDERVTVTAAVPTVWLGMLQVLEKVPYDLSSLRFILVGGSAAPRWLIEKFEREFGVPMCHGYGMTEAAPVTHLGRLKSYMEAWDPEARLDQRAKQGLLLPGLEMRVVDLDTGQEVPWDGRTMGEIWLRGPWIASEYYQDERSAATFVGGWYRTGDVATVDPEGYIQIVDRTKDVIKSGGEWISSVDLENAIMSHPGVLEAAVVGVPHPRWQERPLACVVPRPEWRDRLTREAILDHLAGRFARWWVPDDVVFLDEIPKTSTLKFDKKVLRERFRGHYGGA